MDAVSYVLAKKYADKKAQEIKDSTYKTVDELPEVGESGVMYLVPSTSADDNYDEYCWVEEDQAYNKLNTVDLSNYYDQDEIDSKLDDKQDEIEDLETIRSGAAEGATALQPEDLEYASETDIRNLFKVYPVKGDIISFDALGRGTRKRFRVLNVEGTNVKLLGLENLTTSLFNGPDRRIPFDNGDSYQNYRDSSLDSYLNITYYNSLSAAVKAAIIDETFVQSCYNIVFSEDSPSASATFNGLRLDNNKYNQYTRTTQQTVGTRHIHALDVDELKDYFELVTGDTLDGADLLELFTEQRSAKT